MAEKPTTVRFKPDINAGIREVAEDLGISFNAALSVLVVEALKARGRQTASQRRAAEQAASPPPHDA